MSEKWTWENGTPRERAYMIRQHNGLTEEQLCELFDLSIEGLRAIKRGADWNVMFTAPHREDKSR